MTRRNGLTSAAALLVVGLLVGAIVAGCGIRPSSVIHGQEAPKGMVASLTIYLIDHNALRPVSRPLPPVDSTSAKLGFYISTQQQALNALLDGPTATDAAGGLTSDIPAKTAASIPPFDGITFPVFVKSPEGPLTQHAVDQIACTIITSLAVDGSINNYQVQVYDGRQPRPKQGCPAATP
jgi:hypothetical protein